MCSSRIETRAKKDVHEVMPFGRNVLRTTDTVISMGYERKVGKKSIIQKKVVNRPKKHVIHKAIRWKKMLDDGKVKSF